MAVLVQEDDLALRTMEETEADLRLFLQWMTDPQTMKYWDGMTEIFDYDRVCRHYREHMEEGVTPCFIVLDGEAIGYLQFCEIPDAEANDLPPEEYAPAAIRRCGLYQGGLLRQKAGGGSSLKGLKKTLFTKPAQWVFEMDVKRCDDDHLDIDFHYCPLVKAWQKQGCSDEEIRMLCDHAMCGDRGIAESFGCELDLPATIARGDDVCQLRFVRREKK